MLLLLLLWSPHLDAQPVNFQVLHVYGATTNDSASISHTTVPIEATDGKLYGGFTSYLGSYPNSTNQTFVFRMNSDGSEFTILKQVGVTTTDAQDLGEPLIEGSDGWLYGSTYFGGTSNAGTVFRLQKDGGDYAVLHSFNGGSTDGSTPWGIIEASDGMLYGVTYLGGVASNGVIYRISRDGATFQKLRDLGSTNGEPVGPCTRLLEASDGALYGCTAGIAGTNAGGIYRLNKEGTGLQVLRIFNWPTEGGGSPGALVEGQDGTLFGVSDGVSNAFSAVFRVDKSGSNLALLATFTNSGAISGGTYGWRLALGPDGYLYGNTGGSFPDPQAALCSALNRMEPSFKSSNSSRVQPTIAWAVKTR